MNRSGGRRDPLNSLRSLASDMPTTAEFTVPAREFPLGRSFQDLADVTVELETVVPTSRTVVPYLWVRDASAAAVGEALAAHHATQEVTVVESVADRHLLRVDWNPAHEGFTDVLAAADVVLLTATGNESAWRFTIRGDDRAAISDFQSRCGAASIPVEFTALADLEPSDDGLGLTEAQREALTLAYERGYFDSPRRTTLEELGAELGISRQALAARLRRGHRRLLERTLVDP